MNEKINKSNHSAHCLHVHLVFIAKYRRKAFSKSILESMKSLFDGVADELGFSILEVEGELDHIHLLVNYPPKLAISDMAHRLKGRSSRQLKQMHPVLNRYFWGKGIWSPSYFAGSCGGASIETIKKYIENQNTPTH